MFIKRISLVNILLYKEYKLHFNYLLFYQDTDIQKIQTYICYPSKTLKVMVN